LFPFFRSSPRTFSELPCNSILFMVPNRGTQCTFHPLTFSFDSILLEKIPSRPPLSPPLDLFPPFLITAPFLPFPQEIEGIFFSFSSSPSGFYCTPWSLNTNTPSLLFISRPLFPVNIFTMVSSWPAKYYFFRSSPCAALLSLRL